MSGFVNFVTLVMLRTRNISYFHVNFIQMKGHHYNYTKLNSFSTFNSLSTQEKFHFIMSYNEGDIEVLSHIIQFVNSCCEKRRMAQVWYWWVLGHLPLLLAVTHCSPPWTYKSLLQLFLLRDVLLCSVYCNVLTNVLMFEYCQ